MRGSSAPPPQNTPHTQPSAPLVTPPLTPCVTDSTPVEQVVRGHCHGRLPLRHPVVDQLAKRYEVRKLVAGEGAHELLRRGGGCRHTGIATLPMAQRGAAHTRTAILSRDTYPLLQHIDWTRGHVCFLIPIISDQLHSTLSRPQAPYQNAVRYTPCISPLATRVAHVLADLPRTSHPF